MLKPKYVSIKNNRKYLVMSLKEHPTSLDLICFEVNRFVTLRNIFVFYLYGRYVYTDLCRHKKGNNGALQDYDRKTPQI